MLEVLPQCHSCKSLSSDAKTMLLLLQSGGQGPLLTVDVGTGWVGREFRLVVIPTYKRRVLGGGDISSQRPVMIEASVGTDADVEGEGSGRSAL